MGASEYQASCSHSCSSPSRPEISTSGALSYTGCKDRDYEVLKAYNPRTAKQELPILENDMGVKGFSDGGQSPRGEAPGHLTALALPPGVVNKTRNSHRETSLGNTQEQRQI